ncbi:MAG TPA: DPP IV N-terminal domain-containing protein [Rudaea sp.]|nr:DPP IV N-terminal domain-containing protein [Rudaea sp.]
MRVVMGMLLVCMGTAAMADELTIARMFANPNLNGPSARQLEIAPDGSRVTFLRGAADDQHRLDLWEFDVASKRERRLVDARTLEAEAGAPSAAALARRERERTAGDTGVSHHRWAPDSRSLLFTLGDSVYLYTFGAAPGKEIERLSKAGTNIFDARISPGGRYVSFVSQQNLWIIDLKRRVLRRLTRDGGGPIHNGEAEFVAQEEMGRTEGYWWAPDDSAIAFERYDESAVPNVARAEIFADRTAVVEQRYPAAGQPNVRVRLGVAAINDRGGTRWIDLGQDPDIYLARVDWLPDGEHLAVQREARNQRTLDLLVADWHGARTVLTEHAATWIGLTDDLKFLHAQDAFLWSSERSGHRHLYLYGLDGQLRRALTAGAWDVDAVLGVDERAGKVYFSANRDDPLQRQVYAAALDGSTAEAPQRISSAEGWHDAVFARSGTVYVDTWSDPATPPRTALHAADGRELAVLVPNALDEHHPYWPYRSHHVLPEFGTVDAADGQKLYWRMYKPTGFDATRRYPVFLRFYGGPGRQLVNRAWGDLFDQYMAQHGYVVFSLDNRGTPRRGRSFEDPIFRRLGDVEVRDQLAGIAYLKTLPYVDAARIGCFGWSYGGYLSLMLLAQASNELAGGVAVAPVTDWRLYDSHYTERYLDDPAANAQGYEASSVFAHLDGLTAPLFLAHGMADDNVQFTNSTRLMAALQDRGIQFELMTYPGGKHGLSTPAMRTHVFTAIADFFERKVKGKVENSTQR